MRSRKHRGTLGRGIAFSTFSAFSAFSFLLHYPSIYVKAAAGLVVLLGVVYSIGLGVLALRLLEPGLAVIGQPWWVDNLSASFRTTLGAAWVVLCTLAFVALFVRSVLRRMAKLLFLRDATRYPRETSVEAIIAASEEIASYYDPVDGKSG